MLSSSCPPGTSFGAFTAKAPGAFGTRSRGVILAFVLAWLLVATFSFAAEAMVGRIVVVVVVYNKYIIRRYTTSFGKSIAWSPAPADQ